MVLVLKYLGGRFVLAGANEHLQTRTYTHFVSFIWVWGATLAFIALIGVGAFLGGSIHPLIFVVSVLISLPFALFAVIYGLYPFHEIVLTDRNVYRLAWRRHGVVKFTAIPLESITSVVIRQSKLARLLKYGDLLLQLAVCPSTIRLKWIPNVNLLKQNLQIAIVNRQRLLPITRENVQSVVNELRGVYDQSLISEKEFELVERELRSQVG